MRWLLRLGLMAAVAALAPAAPAAPVAPDLPPFTPAYTPTTTDERGLWQIADEFERTLRDAPSIVRDPALNAYVRTVLCRAVGTARCAGVRLYIQRVPAFNASMSPNGAMVVWTGLLLRLRNEAELAATLGHEYGHFELRHTLGAYKRGRTTGDLLAWTSLLGGGVAGQMLVGLQYAYLRGEESQADLMGLRYLRAAGYRASAAPQVWDRVLAEADATAVGRKRPAGQHRSTGFFADHPSDLARATALRQAAGDDAEQGVDNQAAYRAAMAPWRGQWLADQIKLNDFGGTEYLLDQLADGTWTPDLLVARGDLYRERGQPRDLVSAATFYRQAIDGGTADPTAWRGLGLTLLRSGSTEPGRVALASYLTKAPAAADHAAMAMLIGEGEVR